MAVFGAKPYLSPTMGETPAVPAGAEALPRGWLAWLQKAAATRAEERFPSAEAMAKALRR
jgi:hypothetical protein